MNRRHHFILSLIGLFLALCLTSCGFQPVSLAVNGQVIDSLQVIKRNNVLYVPDTFISDTLQLPVQWVKARSSDTEYYYSNKVAVLMYHELTEGPDTPDEMSILAFEEHMRLLQEHRFTIITMEQYTAFILEGAPVPDNAVLITFDDGYESFYSLAYPVLREYGYTAANFVIVSAIDNRTGRPKLSWEQMREMEEQGFSFHSHTYDSHIYGPVNAEEKRGPVLSNPLYLKAEERTESETEYLRRIKSDLNLGEQRLQEELGHGSLALAFPYGAHNPQVEQTLQELGVPLSFTTKPGINTPGQLRGFRINAAPLGEELISRLQAYQLEMKEEPPATEATEAPSELKLVVNHAVAALPGVKPPRDGRDGLIPLRAFCEAYGIKLTWQPGEKRVDLTL